MTRSASHTRLDQGVIIKPQPQPTKPNSHHPGRDSEARVGRDPVAMDGKS